MSKSTEEQVTIVYLDFSEDDEFLGRVVIELNKTIVPKSVENFRALCTGEKGVGKLGRPLHYKDSIIHRAVPQFMIQGGDITSFNGSGGESIYGLYFKDENFEIKHTEPGTVSMANTGKPNTNNSQFFITVVPCEHLDGRNVAIGRVIKGFQVVRYISESKTDDEKPLNKYNISNCGELPINSDYGINVCDGTKDTYPPWPHDWNIRRDDLNADELLKVVTNIKDSGNEFFKRKRYALAGKKYFKAMEYIDWYTTITSEKEKFSQLRLTCLLNLSAVKLRIKHYKDCLAVCDRVLEMDGNNPKAIFRKGQANVGLNNHKVGLQYLKQAHGLVPYDKNVMKEIRQVKKFMNDYLVVEKTTYARMFKK